MSTGLGPARRRAEMQQDHESYEKTGHHQEGLEEDQDITLEEERSHRITHRTLWIGRDLKDHQLCEVHVVPCSVLSGWHPFPPAC